jgi:hypothetical protein
MTFFPNTPQQKAPFFGVQRMFVRSAPIGGANLIGGATAITASGTTIFRLGGFAGRRVQAVRLAATAVTAGISASGTILAKLVKYDASADAAVDLTQNVDLEALTTREESWAERLTTLTAAQATVDPGDALEVHVVSDNAIGTQPANLVFTVEVLVLE